MEEYLYGRYYQLSPDVELKCESADFTYKKIKNEDGSITETDLICLKCNLDHEEKEFKAMMAKRHIDPYAILDSWLPFYHEDEYTTYLKCHIWVTDGEIVEWHNSYKESPYAPQMSNGKYAKFWLLPNLEKFDFDNPPPPPSSK